MVWVMISSTIFTQEFRDFQSAFGFMSRVAIAADKARAPGSQAVLVSQWPTWSTVSSSFRPSVDGRNPANHLGWS